MTVKQQAGELWNEENRGLEASNERAITCDSQKQSRALHPTQVVIVAEVVVTIVRRKSLQARQHFAIVARVSDRLKHLLSYSRMLHRLKHGHV